jgi:hypothetical protein
MLLQRLQAFSIGEVLQLAAKIQWNLLKGISILI